MITHAATYELLREIKLLEEPTYKLSHDDNLQIIRQELQKNINKNRTNRIVIIIIYAQDNKLSKWTKRSFAEILLKATQKNALMPNLLPYL